MQIETLKDQIQRNREAMATLHAKMETNKAEFRDMLAAHNALSEENTKLADTLREMRLNPKSNKDEILISDHALIRYLERFVGVDVDSMRKELQKHITPKISKGKIPFRDGLKFVIEDGVVVTIT
jgi:hypothetical protein